MRRSAERLPCLFRHSRNTARGSVSAHFVRGNAKGTPLACLSLSIKSFFRLYSVSRGSAHEIDFAKQNHKNREHVSRFLYLKREKVSAWELSDVRVLRSQNTDCRKNVSFSTGSGTPTACLFSWVYDKLKFLILSIAPSHQFPFSVFASCKPPCPGIFFVSIPCIAAFFRRTEAAIKCNALRKDFLIIIRS